MFGKLTKFLKKVDFRLFIYGMFSNWGIIIFSNIIGLFFINSVGVDIVRRFSPFLYALLSIGLFFPMPKSKDFKLGYLIAFVIGLVFLFKFYYPLFLGF